MPTCQNCQHVWSWWETLKRPFIGVSGATCPVCLEKQYVTARMRRRGSVFPALIILIFFFGTKFFNSSGLMLGFIVIIGIVSIMIHPFFIELSNEEEPLF